MWLYRICLAIAAVVACAHLSVAQTPQKAVLLLNWYLYSEHAPFFLGKERGYFKEAGIDLDIQEAHGRIECPATDHQKLCARSKTSLSSKTFCGAFVSRRPRRSTSHLITARKPNEG